MVMETVSCYALFDFVHQLLTIKAVQEMNIAVMIEQQQKQQQPTINNVITIKMRDASLMMLESFESYHWQRWTTRNIGR